MISPTWTSKDAMMDFTMTYGELTKDKIAKERKEEMLDADRRSPRGVRSKLTLMGHGRAKLLEITKETSSLLCQRFTTAPQPCTRRLE